MLGNHHKVSLFGNIALMDDVADARGFSGGSWLRVALLTPSGASQKSVTVLFNTAFRHFAILCNNASQHSQGM